MNITKTGRLNVDRSDTNSLMAKVMALLSGSLVISSIGTYMGLGITSVPLIIGLFVLLFLGIFGVALMAKYSPALGVAGLAIWTFLNGLVLGPTVNMYAAELGWQTVSFSFLGTAGVMAALGSWGAFSGRDFSGMGRWLLFGLLGLIIVGIIGMFAGFGHTFNLLYALGGIVIFAGYFIFDFYRLANSEDTDFNAILITLQIYLDFVNFWLSLMRLLAELKR